MEGMRYLKLFENFQDIDSLCEEHGIENYTIGSDGLVNVDGHVYLSYSRLENIPIKFGKVGGNFDFYENKLTSLDGCPKEVGGYFSCSINPLTSLEGCPKEVGGDFKCSNNELKSLLVGPKEVGGNFNCSWNKLTSLEGCIEEIGGNFDFYENKLTSFEVKGYFWCYYNKLTIIDYLPEWIEGDIDLSNNKIRDIKVEDKNYIFSGKCDLSGNPINCMFQYWEGDLKNFIIELEFEDFIRDDGKSLDITRFEYALDGKEYNIYSLANYKLIWKE